MTDTDPAMAPTEGELCEGEHIVLGIVPVGVPPGLAVGGLIGPVGVPPGLVVGGVTGLLEHMAFRMISPG